VTAVPGPKHIGIVGMSAEGAALCYRTICVEAQEALGRYAHPEVTMHTYSFADYMRLIEEDRWEETGRLMLASAAKLAHLGAAFAICPDNTAHQALDLVRADSPIPWLHIAEEVAALASARGFRRVGLLGTRWLMEGPVYPPRLAAHGIAHELPDPEARAVVDRTIFNELVHSRFEERSRRRFQEIIGVFESHGCDAVILGCTEIPLLIGEADSPLPILDSTRTLARAALREATAGGGGPIARSTVEGRSAGAGSARP
jgi:aspartate racemase